MMAENLENQPRIFEEFDNLDYAILPFDCTLCAPNADSLNRNSGDFMNVGTSARTSVTGAVSQMTL